MFYSNINNKNTYLKNNTLGYITLIMSLVYFRLEYNKCKFYM